MHVLFPVAKGIILTYLISQDSFKYRHPWVKGIYLRNSIMRFAEQEEPEFLYLGKAARRRCPHLWEEQHHVLVSDFIFIQKAFVRTYPLSPALQINGFHNTSGIWLNLSIWDTISVILELGNASPSPAEYARKPSGVCWDQLNLITFQADRDPRPSRWAPRVSHPRSLTFQRKQGEACDSRKWAGHPGASTCGLKRCRDSVRLNSLNQLCSASIPGYSPSACPQGWLPLVCVSPISRCLTQLRNWGQAKGFGSFTWKLLWVVHLCTLKELRCSPS